MRYVTFLKKSFRFLQNQMCEKWRYLTQGRAIEQQLHLLMDGITDYAFLFLNAQGEISVWPPSAEREFGYLAKDILGKPLSNLYTAQDADDGKPAIDLQIAATHGRVDDSGWKRKADGTSFWANAIICPVRNKDQRLNGYSIVIHNLTDKKAAEEYIRQQEEELFQARKVEALGRLSGGIAHDFNNLIAGIIGLGEDIREQMGPSDPKRSDMEYILQAAQKASQLTRQLLAFGRRQIVSPQVLNVNTVVRESEKILKRLIGADIEMACSLASPLSNIKVDPGHINQIIMNLVLNARDAMPHGGRITIETGHYQIHDNAPVKSLPPGQYVMLRISDTGCGMDREVMSHVFEPFFTTKEKGQGTGLGLATVHGIVKQNNGEIFVESQVNQGTDFTILFPPVYETLSSSSLNPTSMKTSGKKNETILIAEDEGIVRRFLSRWLRQEGYHVLEASDGEEALRVCSLYKAPIHLLVTDVVMPRLNGKELADAAVHIHPEMRIVFTSAYPKEVIALRGIIEGNVQLIQKTGNRPVLLQKIREILDTPRSMASSKNRLLPK